MFEEAFSNVNDHLDAIFGLTNLLRETYSNEELRIPFEMIQVAENCLDACLDETNRYFFFMMLLNAERLLYDIEQIYFEEFPIVMRESSG
ncbi:unnamed protein product [Caenorhabditis bovis]|uniref:Uncharacterized protein n=1 Tax=Caenorhabditis bovis TaxID=2654633 RepID=A0A8S1FCU4_9PELO|nr:unnamed protein product [Caenorhabditis bovis]